MFSIIPYIWRRYRSSKLLACTLFLSAVAIVSGLWISYFTRFSVELVLTEKQSFSSMGQEYPRDSLYIGKFAGYPSINLALTRLNPEFSGGESNLKGLVGDVSVFPPGQGKPQKVAVSSGLPSIYEGFQLRLTDFGYSPRYSLKANDGSIIDSAWVSMKLYPHGTEDAFRLIIPHTFFLRYSPHATGEKRKPFCLRIARNKDLVYNGTVDLNEDVSFDNGKISIDEVRMWTKLSIKRDWGEVLAFLGFMLGGGGMLYSRIKRVKPQGANIRS
ncbi:MAG: hypothetical protein HYS23_14645 [Geobacter sp.]|nr:hypothetical protein [Geobacter sp.]